MSTLNSGRDLIIQLSADLVKRIVLEFASKSEESSCVSGESLGAPGLRFAVWSQDATFQQDTVRGAIVIVAARTQISHESPAFDVPTVFTTFSLEEQLLGSEGIPLEAFDLGGSTLNIAPEETRIRVVGSGAAIAIGMDLSEIGEASDDTLWESFDVPILSIESDAFEWGIALDGAIMQELINQNIRDNLDSIRAEAEGVRLERITVGWGAPLTLNIRGTADTECGEIDFELAGSATFRIVRPNELQLVVEWNPENASPEFEDALQFFFCTGNLWWVAGGVLAAVTGNILPFLGYRLFDVLTSDVGAGAVVQTVRLGRIRTDVPGLGVLLGERVVQTSTELRILGSVDRDDFESPPRSEISVDGAALSAERPSIQFAESASSYCSGIDAPTFPQRRIRVRNASRDAARMWICSVQVQESENFALSDPHPSWIRVAPDGQSLESVPVWFSGGGGLEFTLSYRGPRRSDDVTARLVVNTNDPDHFFHVVELRADTGGTPRPRVVPVEVSLDRANTPGGRRRTRLRNCDELAAMPGGEDMGQFVIHNDGDGPLFLCSHRLEDPADVFNTTFRPISIASRDSAVFSVGFAPDEVGVEYRATLTIGSNAGDITIAIRGTVAPDPFRVSARIGASEEEIGMLVDMLGERLCLPPDADICRAMRFFEPLPQADELLEFIGLNVGPLRAGDELLLRNQANSIQIRNIADGPRANLTLGFPKPDDPGAGIPCIAEFPRKPTAVRIGLQSWVGRPTLATLPIANVFSAASKNDRVYVTAENQLHVIRWGNEEPPDLLRSINVGEAAKVSIGNRLLIASGRDVQCFDIGNPDRPILGGSHQFDSSVKDIAVVRDIVFVADGTGITALSTHDRNELTVVSHQEVSGGVAMLQLVFGCVAAAAESDLHLFAIENGVMQRIATEKLTQAAIALSRFGRHVLVSSESGTQGFKITANRSLFRNLESNSYRDWHIGFHVDASRRLFRVKDGLIREWKIQRRRIERKMFPEETKLRYQPRWQS